MVILSFWFTGAILLMFAIYGFSLLIWPSEKRCDWETLEEEEKDIQEELTDHINNKIMLIDKNEQKDLLWPIKKKI